MSTEAAEETGDDEWNTEMAEPELPPVKRGRGRPRKHPVAGTETVITRRVLDDERETDTESFAALFDEGFISKGVVRVRVTRVDPHEGMLAYFEDQEATEKEILERWGGSTYRLDGLNGRGQILQARTIKIAGDPIFAGEAAEASWRKTRGLPPKGGVTVAGHPQMSPQELMRMMDEREEKRRESEREREERQSKADKEAEQTRRAQEREWQQQREREQREFDLRLRKDEDERRQRQRDDDREREAQRQRDMVAAESRNQQFMTNMLQIVTAAQKQPNGGATGGLGEAVKVVLAIKEAFGGGSDSEMEANPLNLLIRHGGDILNGIGNAAQSAIREVKGGGLLGQQPPAQQPVQPRLGAAPPASTTGSFTLPADSPLTPKLTTLVTKIAAQGRNPEEVLVQVADGLIATLDGQPPPAAQAVSPQTVVPKIKPPGRVSFTK